MSFCTNCGTKLADGINVCPNCGFVDQQQAAPQAAQQPVYAQQQAAPQQPYQQQPYQQQPYQQQPYQQQGYVQPMPQKESGLTTAAKVFMIIGTVLMGIYIIPLAWTIPLTVTYCNKVKRNEPISTGFKVCCLLFVSLLGGIFMLCDKEH